MTTPTIINAEVVEPQPTKHTFYVAFYRYGKDGSWYPSCANMARRPEEAATETRSIYMLTDSDTIIVAKVELPI